MNKQNLLDCIYCSSKKISKSIMSPMISKFNDKKKLNHITNKDFSYKKNEFVFLRKYIEKNFDYVGKDFPNKVREIYYDKKNNKAIYGTATNKEREELAEEGIDLMSIPWVGKEN